MIGKLLQRASRDLLISLLGILYFLDLQENILYYFHSNI